jgi:uncharacterized OsmC-like protein
MGTRVVNEQDLTEPIVRRKTVTARNNASMRTKIDAGELGGFVTDEPAEHGGTATGPSPLQAVLGALCGCESVTFFRTAQELGLAYDGIEFDGEYTIDIRGRMGVQGVRPHFRTVRVQATVRTDAPEEQLRAVVEETERRCPVYNLLSDAGVNVEMLWVRAEQGTGTA